MNLLKTAHLALCLTASWYDWVILDIQGWKQVANIMILYKVGRELR